MKEFVMGGWDRLRAKNAITIIRDVFTKERPGATKKRSTFKELLKKVKLFIYFNINYFIFIFIFVTP